MERGADGDGRPGGGQEGQKSGEIIRPRKKGWCTWAGRSSGQAPARCPRHELLPLPPLSSCGELEPTCQSRRRRGQSVGGKGTFAAASPHRVIQRALA